MPLVRELVLAIGIPLVLVPHWLQRLAERPYWLLNTGIGLIIGLSLLRWLLQR